MTKFWDYESKENDTLSMQVEKDCDIVMTKDSMAKYLMRFVDTTENDILLEPCRGKGAFYNNFPEANRKEWCEINEGKDFLEYTGEPDIICSNPPFVPRKLFWDFQVKAMQVAKKAIYWLINLSSLNVFTPKRLEEMNSKGWYIQSFHIVNDKRWYGRYVFVKITKEPNNIVMYNKKTF